ncbi:MAG: hypothetical protein Q8P04_00950 [bacterium]|nr:hypothetical protein [bacterium]
MLKTILKTLSDREDLFLRLAVAFPMIWAGVHQMMNPTDWIGFVPPWLGSFIAPEAFLTIHSVFNIVIGIGLLIGFWRILFSAAAVASLASIVIFYGVDDITFRDAGLTIVAFVLFLRALQNRWEFRTTRTSA